MSAAPLIMPTPRSQQRLERYLLVADAAGSQFVGQVLMSLMILVDDDVWEEAIDDAMRASARGAS